jgi:hypothetical protein
LECASFVLANSDWLLIAQVSVDKKRKKRERKKKKEKKKEKERKKRRNRKLYVKVRYSFGDVFQ